MLLPIADSLNHKNCSLQEGAYVCIGESLPGEGSKKQEVSRRAALVFQILIPKGTRQIRFFFQNLKMKQQDSNERGKDADHVWKGKSRAHI